MHAVLIAGCRVVLLLVALSATPVSAQTAVVSGRVTDEAGGAPLQGAAIQIRNRTTFSLVASVTSDANGDFSASAPSGTYIVFAQAAGFRTEIFDGVPCGQSCDFNAATPLVVTAPTAVPGIDFALLRLGSVSGRVVRAGTGVPLEGVNVNAVALDGAAVAGATTNANGDFLVEVEPGDLRLRTSNEQGFVDELFPDIACPFGACDPSGATVFSIASGQSITGNNFVLAAGGTIGGTVTRAGGPVNAGVQIEVYRPDGTLLTAAEMDPDGSWRVSTGLPTGSYRAVAVPFVIYAPEVWNNRPCGPGPCDPTTGDPIAVTASAATTGIDFALSRINAAFSGVVTTHAGGAPLGDVPVRALPADGGPAIETLTAADGTWTIDDVPPGTYTLRAIAPPPLLDELHPGVQCGDPVDPNFCAGSGTPIPVVAGQEVSGLNFALAIGGSLEVTLRNVNTLAAMAGTVEAALPGYVSPRSFTAASGSSVVIPVLNGGNVRLRAISAACGPLANAMCLGERFPNSPCPHFACDLGAGDPIAVAKGATVSGIELELLAGATIAGLVAAQGGAPIPGAAVELLDPHGALVTGVLTGKDGSYLTSGLGAGPYLARTSAPSPFRDELYDNVPCAGGLCNLGSGTQLTPTIGQTLGGIDFLLPMGGTIAGTVRNALGTPIGGSVTVFNTGGATVAAASADEATGQYSTAGLEAGSYFVRFDAPGRDAILFNGIACPNGECDPSTGTPVQVTAGEPTLGIDAMLPGNIQPLPRRLGFLNRCVGGCVVRNGFESSINNTSSIVSGTRTLGAYPFGDASFNAVAACLRAVFRPYNIQILTQDPGNVSHIEHMIGGNPGDLGFGNGTGGVSPFSCFTINNSISFTFAAIYGDDVAELCHTAAHEIGHQFGLDHEFLASDPMTYLTFPDPYAFARSSEPCGELGTRPCVCGDPSAQNSHAVLASRIGLDPFVFVDGFESAPQMPPNAWQSYRSPFPAPPRSTPLACGTDPVRAVQESLPY